MSSICMYWLTNSTLVFEPKSAGIGAMACPAFIYLSLRSFAPNLDEVE
jgi:hypothetical protein